MASFSSQMYSYAYLNDIASDVWLLVFFEFNFYVLYYVLFYSTHMYWISYILILVIFIT